MHGSTTAFFAEVSATPSAERFGKMKLNVAKAVAPSIDCLGVPVGTTGAVPTQVGLERTALESAGFKGKIGQTLAVPRGEGPAIIAIGVGAPAELSPAKLRDVAAAFARAASRHAHLATTLADVADMPPELAAQTIVEGALLASYRYDPFKTSKKAAAPLAELQLVTTAERSAAMTKGAERGRTLATAAMLGRDLANTPPSLLNAVRAAEIAKTIGGATGLGVEIFDREALIKLGCGGLLGVNRGSADPPRMVKLTYRPKNGHAHTKGSHGPAHLALVGKGVTYDAGGISLKPSDEMHAQMKLDMSGAGAVLASMSALAALECKNAVTGFMMLTDNMPSGSAMKLGDVLTIRGGKTIEVKNTDAEGRLMLADGLVLAVEEKVDAIVNIATLTGACMRALGTSMAGVFGNNQAFVDQVTAAAAKTDEPVWQLPLEKKYRKELDSAIADLKNVGGENAGAITAALFLAEFVGHTPWAHIDICGPMKVDADESWRSTGATAFEHGSLAELAVNFTTPKSKN